MILVWMIPFPGTPVQGTVVSGVASIPPSEGVVPPTAGGRRGSFPGHSKPLGVILGRARASRGDGKQALNGFRIVLSVPGPLFELG